MDQKDSALATTKTTLVSVSQLLSPAHYTHTAHTDLAESYNSFLAPMKNHSSCCNSENSNNLQHGESIIYSWIMFQGYLASSKKLGL